MYSFICFKNGGRRAWPRQPAFSGQLWLAMRTSYLLTPCPPARLSSCLRSCRRSASGLVLAEAVQGPPYTAGACRSLSFIIRCWTRRGLLTFSDIMFMMWNLVPVADKIMVLGLLHKPEKRNCIIVKTCENCDQKCENMKNM